MNGFQNIFQLFISIRANTKWNTYIYRFQSVFSILSLSDVNLFNNISVFFGDWEFAVRPRSFPTLFAMIETMYCHHESSINRHCDVIFFLLTQHSTFLKMCITINGNANQKNRHK